MALFIEKPGDEYGNTGKPPAVIEAHVKDEFSLYVDGPPEISNVWPTAAQRFFFQIDESDGPARMLPRPRHTGDRNELRELWEKYGLWPLRGLSEHEKTIAVLEELDRRAERGDFPTESP